jgi:hypothetical protein
VEPPSRSTHERSSERIDSSSSTINTRVVIAFVPVEETTGDQSAYDGQRFKSA